MWVQKEKERVRAKGWLFRFRNQVISSAVYIFDRNEVFIILSFYVISGHPNTPYTRTLTHLTNIKHMLVSKNSLLPEFCEIVWFWLFIGDIDHLFLFFCVCVSLRCPGVLWPAVVKNTHLEQRAHSVPRCAQVRDTQHTHTIWWNHGLFLCFW